jgi:hypothetical protein
MSPKKLVTRRADPGQARARLRIAQKYLEVAELVATEDGAAVNVCVGLAVLAGISAGDAVCIVATGERYSGQDHMSAAELLERVDAGLGKRLRLLVGLKPGSHYGEQLLGIDDRKTALRAAQALVRAATERA